MGAPVPDTYRHEPVLLDEACSLLGLGPGKTVVDGTVGGGGHARAILERTAPDGRLVGLDVDAEALRAAQERLGSYGDRVRLVRSSFRNLTAVLEELGIQAVDAVLLDLGVSSHQLDTSARGFRFGGDGGERVPLDMRMDERLPDTAADLLARARPEALERWFREYADLPGARRLARAIAETRSRAPLASARDLVELVRAARVGGGRKHHPATLVFQALRIAVNDEIAALEEGLDAAIGALRPGGRVAVIAYHSVEDRAVKNRFRELARRPAAPGEPPARLAVLTRRPLRPGPDELARNPRARSARLRAAERTGAAA
jgi:16S rRNA (cytosine1402-N4)-methyltransferase